MSGGIGLSAFDNMSARRRKDTPPGRVIPVQGVKDSSYMESVKNFFFDISQTYSSSSQVEEKESVIWARLFDFQSVLCAEFLDQLKGKSGHGFENILLLLGYKNGIQGWISQKNGDMCEILSLRQGPVKTACLLPSLVDSGLSEKCAIARPLLAVCMAADRKQLFTCVRILSLRTGDEIEQLKFENEIQEIQTGCSGLLIITFSHEIQVFDTTNFIHLFTIDGCYQSTGKDVNPIAVSNEWLAYAPAKPMPNLQSGGGMEGDGINSYTATVINAAKTITQGLVNLGETVNWLAKSSMTSNNEQTGTSPRDVMLQHTRSLSGGSLPEISERAPGFITVLNVQRICKLMKRENAPKSTEDRIFNSNIPTEAMVAHFPAHEAPVACMEFSSCGSLLATADQQGHAFHVFSILPHPVNTRMSAAHHMYTLHRGDTSAKVLQISFSSDCRWLCASTHRGTSHVFPVSTYGGSATMRTHVSNRVVNRSSLFHKSAGLEDLEPSGINAGAVHNSLHGSNSPAQSRGRGQARFFASRIHNSTNPRLPPHPRPTLVQPLAQIGATWSPQVLGIPKITGQNNSAKLDKSTINWQSDVVVATSFLSGKLLLSNSSGHENVHRRTHIAASSKGEQCLLIFTSTGQLTEYHLEPKPQAGLKRISEDSPIELSYLPSFQWSLQRSKSWDEVSLPLQPKDPLLEVDNFKRLQKREKNDAPAFNGHPNSHVTSKNHDIFEVENGGVTTEGDEILKVHQPQQLRHPKSVKTSSGGIYPGTAVLAGRTVSKHRMSPNQLLSMSNHSDHEYQARSLSSRDEPDCVKGLLVDDHGRTSDSTDLRPSSAESMRSDKSVKKPTDYEEWLSQVEMISHEGPARRLWMGPQFCFKLRKSTGSTTFVSSSSSATFSNRVQNPISGSANGLSARVGLCLDEDLDVCSLNIRPNQSEPVPTPMGSSDRYDSSAITIEAGSGNFDRTAYMPEYGGSYGSWNDEKLREKLAEAMQDSDFPITKSRGIRSESESSDLEITACPDTILNAVTEFQFDEVEGTT